MAGHCTCVPDSVAAAVAVDVAAVAAGDAAAPCRSCRWRSSVSSRSTGCRR